MRYVTKVVFVQKGQGERYDPIAGEFLPDEEKQTIKPCRVYDLAVKRTLEIYGRTNVRAWVVIHQGASIPADTVKIGSKFYHVSSRREVRGKASYIVSESKVSG